LLVVDTSAVLNVLLAEQPDEGLVERLAEDGGLEAPHLIDVELLHALRKLVRLGEVSADRASDARSDFASLALTRYSHEPLAERIWALRENLTAYDAAFVALAETLRAPLVTCDERLSGAPCVSAKVEVYGRG